LPGGLGGTYAGNPLACAAALAVLDVFEEEKLLDRSKAVGETLVSSLKTLAQRHKSIGDVRGLGAMVAVELFKGGDIHQPDADLTKRVCAEALKRGLVMLSCGSYANVLRILVPLTVPQAQLEEGLAILAQAFDAAAAS
ncbi:MAG TPA: aminotransferase class III-fold pyridoxal phosphate-dependent enzyme, partial [Ideonella sp.]|nr:aminotransferase class III-fold pyridoxal phosphate-dependent enzyme [Ideonella sp.]